LGPESRTCTFTAKGAQAGIPYPINSKDLEIVIWFFSVATCLSLDKRLFYGADFVLHKKLNAADFD
jgi:hypothetical protein